MSSEIKLCQNCKNEFTIALEDFNFYEKIKVPPPTFCPKCRFQRRLAFFNIFNLYQRKCDFCKNEMISIFPANSPYKIFCQKCWWSDKWSSLDYGREYDFSQPFFKQFNELLHEVPLIGLANDATNVNSPYNNMSGHLKNCYLLFHADFSENSAYGFHINRMNDCLDSSIMTSCELCYDSMHAYKCSRCVGSRSQVVNSVDCAFLRDSFNCQSCFASANLRNKKYYIFNKPHKKEDYLEEIKKWNLGSYKTYKEIQRLAEEHWKKFPPKPNQDDFSVNSIGSYVNQAKNCKQCFEVVGAEDSKYLLMLYVPPIKDCYDVSSWGNNISLFYECCNCGENSSSLRFSYGSGIDLYDADYCYQSLGGSNQFGCVSTRKGEYMIFNKRYSKEDYEKLREKIIAHMQEMPYTDKKGRVYKYGEFFPPELSPFAYNETLAQNFFTLSEAEAESKGFRWRELEKKEYQITMKAADLPDHIKDIGDDILKEVISCQKCGRGYKIIQMELDFLRKMNLPLSRECPFCRINDKLELWVKNLRVFDRVCSKCGARFQTHYPKEEVSYILCKKCWLAEFV
ncbi:MAG: Uncharacterized protein G01um101430_627 [Parcubacteria group bacterium Gr01-1014_30]|nr:MAG: Uncharacterized protein G01um101430_627 [Parcubacteria group bacterium Gr01-1014_30]